MEPVARTSKGRVVTIFGATGQTGRIVVRHLLAAAESESLVLQIYVRSKAKLVDLLPQIASNTHVKVFEGSITDIDLVQSCCHGATDIICTLGENVNMPGVRIMQDAANGILTSLEASKASCREWQKPRMVLLSSSTWNPRFAAARPAFVHWLIKTAFSHPYADLVAAQNRLLANPSLLSMLLIQPPVLIDEEPTGYEISTESVRLAVSYEDLGAAFAELILDDRYQGLSAVGVSSKLGDRPARYAPEIFRRVFWGMFAHLKHMVLGSNIV